MLRHQESLQRLLPWTDWLQSAQPSVERWQRSRAEERLAALESLKAAELVQELESAMRRQDVRMEGQRKSVQDLESSLTILREASAQTGV
ncbi:unnamed protein product [Effrenium voratum]|nr:unnamed protein product [Effrenium voratum]